MASYKKSILFLIASMLICAALIVSIFYQIRQSAVQEINERQRIYARLAAKGIETVLDHHINILEALAKSRRIIGLNKDGEKLLRESMKGTGKYVKGVTRTNNRGKIVYTFPSDRGTIGVNIAGQSHMQKILQTNKPVVSDIFDSVQGFQAVAVHVPVFRGKIFDGTVGFLISFTDLAKDYLNSLYIPRDRYALLINAKGKIMFCFQAKHIGHSPLEFLQDNPSISAMLEDMRKGKEGETVFQDRLLTGNNKETQRVHAVYVPVHAGDGFWSVAVISSERLILPWAQNVTVQVIVLAFILMIFFALTIYVAARMRSAGLEDQKRRSMEENLLKSAQEISDLYHNAPCGYHSLDAQGRIVRINDMELAWLGYTREELLGKPYSTVLTETSRDQFMVTFARLKKDGFVRDAEYEIKRKDGSTFPVLVTASAITDARGDFVMTRSMVADITLRRAQEQRLRESEALYRTALETTSDGITIVDIATGTYLYANQRLLDTIGRPDENLIGKPMEVYVHPDDVNVGRTYFRNRKRGLTNEPSYEIRSLRPDGSIVILSVKLAETFYEGKMAAISFMTNVTERRRAEDALRESEELYRTALESTSDGVTILQDGIYVYVNQKFLNTLGILSEAILNRPLGVLAGDKPQKGLRDFLNRHPLAAPVPDVQVTRVMKSDGTVIYLQSSSVDIIYLGKPAILTFVRDITESKKAEQALKESEELYRTALESTSDGVTIVQDGRYVYISQRLLSTIGRPDLKLIGSLQGQYVHPDDWAKLTQAYRQRRHGDPIPSGYELRVPKPDGSTVYLHTTAVIVKYAGRRAILSFIRDITRQKETENALRESEALYRTALESTSDGITIADAKEGKYLFVNHKMMDTLGRPDEKILGRTIDLYVHSDDAGLGRKYYAERKKEGKPSSYYEARIIKADGSITTISVTATDIVYHGRDAVISFVQDITERKKTEAALRESEELYRTALEKTNDGISIIQDGKYVYANTKLLQTIGREDIGIIGQPLGIYTHPDDRERVRGYYQARQEGLEAPANYDMKVLKPDGSVININIHSVIIKYQGKPATLSFILDITERKKAEAALKESEELYRSALENTSDGISIVQESRYVYVNSKFLQTIGRKESEIIHMPLGIFIHPDDAEKVKNNFIARVRGNTASPSYDIRVVKPDGSYIILNLRAVKIDYQGKPATLSFMIDVTERNRAEEALRRSEERYRTIIESIDDDYFETDLEGVVTFFNRPFACSGISREELIGTNHHQYMKPESVQKAVEFFKKVYTTGKTQRMLDYDVIRRDGSIAHEEMSVSLMRDINGRPIGFRGISRDVTQRIQMEEERKRLTEQLYQAQKMEAIGTLAGGIAHDFNNLLMGIQGYTSLMLLEEGPTHPHYEQLRSVQTLVQSGANLTRQLLGFARAGRYEVVSTNLNDLISKSLGLFARTRKEISLHENYAENVWSAEVDRGQIEQVLLNLFVNAWQAMPGGGSLYITTENILMEEPLAKIHNLTSGPYIKISITDTGVGMDENTKQRIFDPFFTTKEMGRGTGLGLASAYGIIKGHAGMISVYSEKGHGTTFNIYLPASSKIVDTEEPANTELPGGRETILLVDDEAVITDVTSRLLEELGYRIITASGGREAIDIYGQKSAAIDLVILDMIMPGMSGSETFDHLKGLNPSVRVILSSGYSLNGKAKAIMDKGVRLFLQKPYRLHDLAQKIREALAD